MAAQHFDLDPDIHYLNHAAVSPWPVRTAEAVTAFARDNARVGSKHYLHWNEIETELRDRLRLLINARSTDEIGLLKSTSEGLSIIAHGLPWQSGDNIVIPDQEFPSNRIVWESLIPYGVEVRQVDIDCDEPEQALLAAMDERTRLLSVSAVQYGTGLRLDLMQLGRFCEQHEILFCIDAIQAIGALAFDVRKCRADFVVADGHKWMLGPEGLALFYCRRELLDQLTLHQFGWHMIEHMGDFDRREWEPAGSARRFECGSPNMIAIHALHASIGVLLEVGMDQVEAAIRARTALVMDFIQQHADAFQLITPSKPERHAGIVTFRPLRENLDALFARLQAANVQCAKRAGGIRFSPHFYTDERTIQHALSLLTGNEPG